MVKKVTNEYNEESIQVLEGLEAVRKRPGMYIGSTDVRGLNHLIYEVVDNSVDEALAGHGNEIDVKLYEDGSVKVSDNGRGLPVGMHSTGKSAVEVIFTVLHAGGKFGGGGYKTSGGLHGVGASVVNALSSYVEVTVKREGHEWYIKFSNGGKVEVPLTKVRKLEEGESNGSSVKFLPDSKIFSTTHFSRERIKERLKEAAYLIPDLVVSYKDETTGDEAKYEYSNGIKEYIEEISEPYGPLTAVQLNTFTDVETGIECDIAYVWVDSGSDETLLSYANNVRTIDGGTHEIGFKNALTKSVNDYAKREKLLKGGIKKLEANDIREGLMAMINIRISEELLQFEGQTKGKLGTQEAKGIVEKNTYSVLSNFLNANKDFASLIIDRSIQLAQSRENARKERDKIKTKKTSKKGLISEKLVEPNSPDVSKRELFLVEGDSAGGSAKSGRNRVTQGVLPLRGKVLNTEKASLEKAMLNKEIRTLIEVIGTGFGDDYNPDKLRYDKIIILTDADVDGSHIQVLLLTFFYNYMPRLIMDGHLYIAKPPLYALKDKKGKYKYYWDKTEVRNAMKETDTLMRFKGLGEMDAMQLEFTTLNPDSRVMAQVTIDDRLGSTLLFNRLMGDDTAPRKKWIESNVDFTADTDIL